MDRQGHDGTLTLDLLQTVTPVAHDSGETHLWLTDATYGRNATTKRPAFYLDCSAVS